MAIKRGTPVMFMAASPTGCGVIEDPKFEFERDKEATYYYSEYGINIGDIGTVCGDFDKNWYHVAFKDMNKNVIVPMCLEHFKIDFSKDLLVSSDSESDISDYDLDEFPKLEQNKEREEREENKQCWHEMHTNKFWEMKTMWRNGIDNNAILNQNKPNTPTSIKCVHAACLEAVRWSGIIKEKDNIITNLKSELDKVRKLNTTRNEDFMQSEIGRVIVEGELEKVEIENVKLKEYISDNSYERRYDIDGNAYTYNEFIDYYGVLDGYEIWQDASFYDEENQKNEEIKDKNIENEEIKAKLTHIEKVMSRNLLLVDTQQTILKEQAQVLQEQKKRLDVLDADMTKKYKNNEVLYNDIETTISNIYDDVFRIRSDQSERISSLEQKSEWVVPNMV